MLKSIGSTTPNQFHLSDISVKHKGNGTGTRLLQSMEKSLPKKIDTISLVDNSTKDNKSYYNKFVDKEHQSSKVNRIPRNNLKRGK